MRVDIMCVWVYEFNVCVHVCVYVSTMSARVCVRECACARACARVYVCVLYVFPFLCAF